jgi:hypothetical protein
MFVSERSLAYSRDPASCRCLLMDVLACRLLADVASSFINVRDLSWEF